jgi:hypothetical protein
LIYKVFKDVDNYYSSTPFGKLKPFISKHRIIIVNAMSTEEFVKAIQSSYREEIKRLKELSELLAVIKDLKNEPQEVYEMKVTIN